MIKYYRITDDGGIWDIPHPLYCGFGITEAIGAWVASAIADAGLATAAAGATGVAGATDLAAASIPAIAGISTASVPALIAGTGIPLAAAAGTTAAALEGGVIGGATDPRNPLQGAAAGALSGGIGSAISPVIGSTLGLGTTAADALGGGIGGAIGSAVTGQNVLTGAAEGGVGGAITGALAPGAPATPGATGGSPVPGGPVGSAASTAAPGSVPAAAEASPAEGLSDVSTYTYGAGATPPGTPSLGTSPASTPAAAAASPSVSGATPPPGLTTPKTTPSTAPASAITLPAAATTPSAVSTPTAPTPAAAPASGGGLSGALNNAGGFLKNNASWLLPAAAIAYEATNANQPLPNQSTLQTTANTLNAQANQLENYLTTGTLPPGIQSGINQASEAAKASIRSQYAAIGNTGSSAEAQDLSAVDERAAVSGGQMALKLLQQGVSEQGMADSLYTDLMNASLTQDQQLGSAIGTFAAALVPRTGTPAGTPATAAA